jgi:hypothetical protein
LFVYDFARQWDPSSFFREGVSQHYSMNRIFESANKPEMDGCLCCALMWKNASPFGDPDETLFLFAALESFPSTTLNGDSLDVPQGDELPFPFNRIVGRTVDNPDKLTLCAFTNEGALVNFRV